MGVEIRQVGACFAGEVAGIDLTEILSTENVKAIHDGMNKYAVLTCRKQPLTAEQQLAFSKQLGIIEHAIDATLREDKDARLPSTFADVSNLDKEDRPFDINDRPSLFAIGNRLWHSDSSFIVEPGKSNRWPVCSRFKTSTAGFSQSCYAAKIVYLHDGQKGDLVMTDNQQTMHKVRPFSVDEPRDMRRATIVGDGPTVVKK